jgi:transcriptional regulator with XRE-family HTH domain
VNDNDLSIGNVVGAIGHRARELRLARGLRQEELASRAGVGVATVRRFEKTGHASLESVVRIAIALRAETSFEKLFEAPPYRSIDDALARPGIVQRQRAPRRSGKKR